MSDSQTYPQERVRIFNRQGYPIAEFRASVERSLVIGDEGRAEFNYPIRKTDVVNEKVLQYGNWILVQSTALPPWVGVIDTPREWSPRIVAVHAYTPEHVFGWRRGPLEVKLTGSAGAIFEKLISYVNAAEATVIRAGNIWKGGKQREETINPTPLSENLTGLWLRSGEDYAWRPVTDSSGRLVVYADWFQQLGYSTPALLHEGKQGGNIEYNNNMFIEDGPILNDILSVGDGMSWQSKPTTISTNAASAEKYGLRQAMNEYSETTSKTTLAANGAQALAQSRTTSKTFHVTALNVGDTYKYIGLGNRMQLRFESMGFTGSGGYETTVRVTGMVMSSDEKNKTELAVEEVTA